MMCDLSIKRFFVMGEGEGSTTHEVLLHNSQRGITAQKSQESHDA